MKECMNCHMMFKKLTKDHSGKYVCDDCDERIEIIIELEQTGFGPMW